MTKKRFIKLLMSKGLGRDTARLWSEQVKLSSNFVCKENQVVKKSGIDFRFFPVNYASYYVFIVDLVNL